MARFQGSTTQQGVQPQADNRQVESESHHWTPEQIQRWQQQQAQQQYHPPHAAPSFQNGPAGDHGAPAGGWTESQYGYGSGYADPAQAVPRGEPPQFGSAQPLGHDAWAQQHRAGPPDSSHHGWADAPGTAVRQSLLDRLGPGAHDDPGNRFGEHAHAADLNRPSAHAPYGHLGQANHDPRYRDGQAQHDTPAWDAGYPAHGGAPAPHGYDPHAPGGYDHGDQQWAGQNGQHAPPFGAQHGHGGYADQGFDAGAPGQHYGYDAQGHAHQDQQLGGFDQHAPDDVEERSRGPRALVVAGALVGAILLGGGLAFVYKKMSNTVDTASTPVVKAEKAPAKAKPATPGGKEVAHTDKRFLNSLSNNPPAADKAAAPAAPADSDGGPRKVTTLVVGRDGSLAAEPPVAPAPPPASSGVPGMVIDGGPRPILRGASPAETASVPAPPPPAVQPQRSAEITFPKARPEPPAAPPVEAEPRAEAPAAKAPPKKKAVVRDDAAAPPATTASAPAPRASNGFVAVLSSRKSREEAFGMYPDLQIKYADTLQGMTPDVREVDLTAQGKGVVYRLIVGPPGSKEAAIATCNKLKAQGYTGCWATPY